MGNKSKVKLGRRKPAGKVIRLPLRAGEVIREKQLSPIELQAWANHREAADQDETQLKALGAEQDRLKSRFEREVGELNEMVHRIERRRADRFHATAQVILGSPLADDEGIAVSDAGVLRVVLAQDRAPTEPSSPPSPGGSPPAGSPPEATSPSEPSPAAE